MNSNTYQKKDDLYSPLNAQNLIFDKWNNHASYPNITEYF